MCDNLTIVQIYSTVSGALRPACRRWTRLKKDWLRLEAGSARLLRLNVDQNDNTKVKRIEPLQWVEMSVIKGVRTVEMFG